MNGTQIFTTTVYSVQKKTTLESPQQKNIICSCNSFIHSFIHSQFYNSTTCRTYHVRGMVGHFRLSNEAGGKFITVTYFGASSAKHDTVFDRFWAMDIYYSNTCRLMASLCDARTS
jgi:hypothetical protein